jgi:hypothetical protein
MPNTTEEGKALHERLNEMSTYDLSFRLAFNQFETEIERAIALQIIQLRDFKPKEPDNTDTVDNTLKTSKPPLKGSKTEKIFNLFNEGKTPVEIHEALTKKKITVYYPEIYRVQRDYFPDRVKKKKKE